MDVLGLLTGDGNSTMVGLLVFLAAGTLAFCVMAIVRVQGSVKRRAADIGQIDDAGSAGRRALAAAFESEGRAAAGRIHHQALCVRQQRRIQGAAPAHDPGRHLRYARGGLFLPGPHRAGDRPRRAGVPVRAGASRAARCSGCWSGSAASSAMSAPSIYIDRRIKTRKLEHQAGFPDFMDLLVVCADAGLSMEAALDRVGRELGDSYPSLTANIHMANLEIRAGRTMSDALEHLGDRLGIDEARSFATLIQQSAELGSSITDALRVYSRRHAPQAAVARRGEGLQPAGQAVGADDDLHLPGAVRGDPAAGDRAAACRQLLSRQLPREFAHSYALPVAWRAIQFRFRGSKLLIILA